MSAVTKGAIERMFESRSAELEYKKAKDKRELAAKMTKDQVDLEMKKLELEVKKSELEMQKSAAIEKTRSLRHAEMMQEAALMHKMGFSKEEIGSEIMIGSKGYSTTLVEWGRAWKLPLTDKIDAIQSAM
ncbi:hypothetical protein SPRG_09700 [Saprolegnia parasitica CBS 223.65]|uniref:Uncharacterized protein n=1 Tax=Saprolegnia parasitica (strain CBS 223.65) TaxID=695850 RepID=A0A067C2F1_SAPPC|nr:hypothetical protein SPRG_09700 [Saprolegnia parasitica CBS 223.65]KDO24969.1 hypothetical protein SPRG_09700 [Saprolegnia parasitica CBS 223.65]|eukprot:XP_012204240.1 hypothetical protein SPRG_09700 [Saprolegnia parasitica CBS 223.65]